MAGEDGGGLTHKLGPLPMWGWALVLGGAVGIVAFLRRRNSSGSGSDTTDTSAQTGTDQVPTTIVPYNQGLSEAQWQQLMAAIRGLYGQPSDGGDDTPPPDTQTDLPAPKTPGSSITYTPPSTSTATSPPKASTGTGTVHPLFITVPSGSGWSWSSIAAQYGHSWQDLWNYNLSPGVRPAETQAKLRSEGASHSLFGGTKVAIPSNWKKV